jgi:hypothetical protein
VSAGRILIIKVGGRSLIPQVSIDEYVEKKIAEAKAPHDLARRRSCTPRGT